MYARYDPIKTAGAHTLPPKNHPEVEAAYPSCTSVADNGVGGQILTTLFRETASATAWGEWTSTAGASTVTGFRGHPHGRPGYCKSA